jgi:hypothetical protein
LHYTGKGEDIDPPRTCDLERSGDLSQCGTRGQHIIDDQYLRVRKRRRVRDGKCLPDVLEPLATAELHLWARRADAHQQTLQHGEVKSLCHSSGEHRRLIKLALHESLSMQGDRDDGVEDGARKVGVEVLEGEVQERLLEVQLAAVFKLVDRLP